MSSDAVRHIVLFPPHQHVDFIIHYDDHDFHVHQFVLPPPLGLLQRVLRNAAAAVTEKLVLLSSVCCEVSSRHRAAVRGQRRELAAGQRVAAHPRLLPGLRADDGTGRGGDVDGVGGGVRRRERESG